ncbi:MAG: TIGR00730 family Rossman fold protein [Patescibacteria group bacterium]
MKEESHTLDQYDKTTAEKLAVISKEFEEGFKFLKKYPRSVTVFGSARFKEDNPYYIHARKLTGKIATELDYTVVTGGGPGIMEAANRGAFEAGGTSIGITISLPHEQTTNMFLTEHLPLYYFFSRKVCLSFFAEAYIFYPGGLGTLDEFFEIFTLVQTNKITEVPIILVGHDYWDDFEKILKEKLIKKFKTIDDGDTDFFTITEDIDQIIEIIRNAPIRNGLAPN